MGMDREEALAAATRLVDEVILEAEAEVDRRRKESLQTAECSKSTDNELIEGGIQAMMKRGSRLQTRAKGFVSRILTQLRICK